MRLDEIFPNCDGSWAKLDNCGFCAACQASAPLERKGSATVDTSTLRKVGPAIKQIRAYTNDLGRHPMALAQELIEAGALELNRRRMLGERTGFLVGKIADQLIAGDTQGALDLAREVQRALEPKRG